MMCVPMAKGLKRNMLLPEYRLAPANPFPAALEDSLKTYRWLLAQGMDSRDIVISGDSAGGGLALATTLALRDAGDPLPAAVICISPWVDLTNSSQTHITNAKVESVLRTDVLNEWALFYTDKSNLTNPLVSPVYADFRGLPPLLIQVGRDEILLDDSLTLTKRAQADGVEVTLRVWDDMWHAWPVLGNLIPESQMAFEEMSEFNQKTEEKRAINFVRLQMNNLPVPSILLELITAGRWKQPSDEAINKAIPFLQEPVDFLLDVETMRRESSGSLSFFQHPEMPELFHMYQGSQEAERQLPWLEVEKALLIAVNRNRGDDIAIALDYRTDSEDPRVVASDWWSENTPTHLWREVESKFSEFVRKLGI